MNITPECIACIFNQALRVTKVLDLDDKTSKNILDLAASHIPQFSLEKTPPSNATPLYHDMAKLLQKEDLYADIKKRSIEQARLLQPRCEKILEKSEDKFLTATKIAVVGNVIDLASQVMYDLDEEVDNIMKSDFAIDDTASLFQRLKSAKKVIYLADNAGENIFDAIYISYLKEQFKEIEFYYFVRGSAIINDLTLLDMEGDRIHELANVVDSGVETPGLVYEKMHSEAKALFDSADCIISKGMGNYECLNTNKRDSIFFLLKVKCEVVSKSLNSPLGAIICKKSLGESECLQN